MRRIAEGHTVACIGTGPSLTMDQVDAARERGMMLFGCNRTFQDVPDLAVLYAINEAFWAHYWFQGLCEYPAEKWTANPQVAEKYRINYVREQNEPGLSRDPGYIHHGHGSGYTLVNLAYLMGAERIVLLGYDLRYAPDYNGFDREIGSAPRHYFGEYPSSMQHWPKMQVVNGVHRELVELYRSIEEQGLVEIVNCTPGSAIDCFERADITSL